MRSYLDDVHTSILVAMRNAKKESPITIDRQFHCRCMSRKHIRDFLNPHQKVSVQKRRERVREVPHRCAQKPTS